jgi:hypothetical protein
VRLRGEWHRLSRLSGLNVKGPRDLEGLYVINDSTGQERDGVLVVKSGRTGVVPSAQAPAKVKLVRGTAGNAKCSDTKLFPNSTDPFPDSSIPGHVYDGFHDFGFQNYPQEELKKLARFHIRFGTNCQRTDHDPGGWSRHVSNRASFSYNQDVVDHGGYTGAGWTLGLVGVGRAARAQELSWQFLERTTEIKPYVAQAGLACLPVTVPYSDATSFFRTNDLAGPFRSDGLRETRY